MKSEQIETPTDNEKKILRPFGVIDVMILTAACAVGIVLMSAVQKYEIFPLLFFFSFTPVWFQVTAWATFVFYFGLTLAAGYRIWLQNRILGTPFVHPGHWMLGGQVLSILGYVLVAGFHAYYTGRSGFRVKEIPWAEDVSNLILGSASLLVAVFFFIAASKTRWTWTGVFASVAVAKFMFAARCVVIVIVYKFASRTAYLHSLISVDQVMGFASVAGTLLIPIAIIVDKVKNRRRDALHWIGVLVLILDIAVLPVMRFILPQFFI